MHLNVAQHFKVLNNAVNGFSSNLDTHIKISLLWSLNEATHLQCSFFLLPLSFQIPARLIWRLDFKSKFIYGWYLYFLSCSKQIQQWYVVNYYFQIIYKALSRSWRCNLWFGTQHFDSSKYRVNLMQYCVGNYLQRRGTSIFWNSYGLNQIALIIAIMLKKLVSCLGLSNRCKHKFKHSFQDCLNLICFSGNDVETSTHYLLHGST